MTEQEVEVMLGRKLKKVELPLFEIYKNNSDYYFTKDSFGNLKVQLKEKP